MKRLQGLEDTLEKSQLNANNLHKSQAEQLESFRAQNQIQQNMQTSMHISQALIDKAAATAANLQAMIDEATTRYKESPTMNGLFGSYSALMAYGLLLSVLGTQNLKVFIAMLLFAAGEEAFRAGSEEGANLFFA